ncbi:uncharacterized protein LOC135215611 isoform X2 [Macrobrachium nipponense]|uniref:uncharacterized protein LOC135215611 isoform X2 n=1 Tax=Macrobrachium nipponense TaxID=159736 RepID=UPI0030C8A537
MSLYPGSTLLHVLCFAVLLSCSTSDQEGGTYTLGRWSSHNNQLGAPDETVKLPGDRFETQNNTVVTGQVGAAVILHCKTSSATGGLVSWIRKRDYQLLTVGLHTHSSDDRFSINYVHWDWQLHIRYVQPRDAGAYECQVSSHPPTSLFVHLEVVEAEAEILGAPEKHVKLGTILRLVCIMHHTTEPLSYVFWYRGTEMINYESDDGAGSVVVESDDHTSVLMVTRASRHHSGNYTCAPSNTKPASILVHVLNEHPAAMQHGEASGLVKPPPLVLIIVMALLTQILFTMPSTSMWHWHLSASPFQAKRTGTAADRELLDHPKEPLRHSSRQSKLIIPWNWAPVEKGSLSEQLPSEKISGNSCHHRWVDSSFHSHYVSFECGN